MLEACRCESHGPAEAIEAGELARVSGVFTDLATGAAIDPVTVTFIYKRRSDTKAVTLTLEDEELVRDKAGVYHVDVPTDEAGPLRYRWASDGDFVGVSEGQVSVRASGVE